MSVNAAIGKLKTATKDLRAQWNEVRGAWHDENAQRFEDDFLAPLLARLRVTELALAHLASVLQQARQDCT
jgi:hypothetical protein